MMDVYIYSRSEVFLREALVSAKSFYSHSHFQKINFFLFSFHYKPAFQCYPHRQVHITSKKNT